MAALDAFFSWTTDDAVLDGGTKYSRWLCSDPDSLENRKARYQIEYWIHSYSTEKQAAIATRYRQLYDEDIVELDRATIAAKYSALKVQLRQVRKRYREKVAFRIRFSLKGLAYATPVISVIITLGGYFYTYRVYSHFGIVASHFFTAGDYLSAGIHAVCDAAIYAVLFSVVMIWRIVDHANLPRYERRRIAVHEKWQRRLTASMCVLVVVIGLIVANAGVEASEWFVLPLYFLGLRSIDVLMDRIFRPSLSLVSMVFATATFAISLYLESNQMIREIERNDPDQDFHLLLENTEITSDEHSIIGSGGGYLFLWQREESQVRIVPHTRIRQMSLSERNE